ncbi:MAG: hypothetical protein ACI4P0_06620, partial [Mailhella sp.]
MAQHQSFFLRFVRSFIGFFLLCFSIAFLIMAKREFDEVTINQVLFHMQLMKDNIVTMPGDFIHVFFWHVKNAVLCALTFAYVKHAFPKAPFRPDYVFSFFCTVLIALWFIVPGSFIDDAFRTVRFAVVLGLAV